MAVGYMRVHLDLLEMFGWGGVLVAADRLTGDGENQ